MARFLISNLPSRHCQSESTSLPVSTHDGPHLSSQPREIIDFCHWQAILKNAFLTTPCAWPSEIDFLSLETQIFQTAFLATPQVKIAYLSCCLREIIDSYHWEAISAFLTIPCPKIA